MRITETTRKLTTRNRPGRNRSNQWIVIRGGDSGGSSETAYEKNFFDGYGGEECRRVSGGRSGAGGDGVARRLSCLGCGARAGHKQRVRGGGSAASVRGQTEY